MVKRRTSGEASLRWTLSFSAHSVGSLALVTATASSSPAWAQTPVPTSSSNTHPTRQLPAGIDVAGVGRDRQCRQPTSDLLRALPAGMGQLLAFAERRIVAGEAECLATPQALLGDLVLDRGKFERQRGN